MMFMTFYFIIKSLKIYKMRFWFEIFQSRQIQFRSEHWTICDNINGIHWTFSLYKVLAFSLNCHPGVYWMSRLRECCWVDSSPDQGSIFTNIKSGTVPITIVVKVCDTICIGKVQAAGPGLIRFGKIYLISSNKVIGIFFSWLSIYHHCIDHIICAATFVIINWY